MATAPACQRGYHAGQRQRQLAYDKVRLEVTRVAAAGTKEIGASAVADYSVKQRLPGISAPSSITRVNGETDNADALLYTVSWSPSDDARIGYYYLCVVDDGGNTVLTLPTTGNVGSLTLDLEQYQGKALQPASLPAARLIAIALTARTAR